MAPQAPAATLKGFEQGLGTPAPAPVVHPSMKASGRKLRQPVKGDAAAAAAPKEEQYATTKPKAKSKKPAEAEVTTVLNLGSRLFQMLARHLTFVQSMAILMVLYLEGMLDAHPDDILREVEDEVDERLKRSRPIRFCRHGAKCRHGHKCRDLHLSHEGLVGIGYFVAKEYTGYWEGKGKDKEFREGSEPVAGFIVERYGLRKTKSGDIVCNDIAPPQLQRWFGAHTSRGAWRGYQPEEAVTLLLRASLMRAKVYLARDARQGKKAPTFTLGLSIKLNGREFTATCFEDLVTQVHRVFPEWGTWFEGENCCVPEGYLLHPTSKNTGYVLGIIFGLTNNPNLLKKHPQYAQERQRVSGHNDRDAMIGAALRRRVFEFWVAIQALKAAIYEWDEHSRKPLTVKCRGTTTEYCTDCARALKERWLHQFHGGPAPERNDIVLAALFDGARDLKRHLREDTWCPGHGKRVANWEKREMAKAEAESGKKPAAKSADADSVAASNHYGALMAPGEQWGDSE